MDRRNFLRSSGVAAGLAAIGARSRAASDESSLEFHGILVDTTKCIGCRNCEFVCAEANGLPEPDFEGGEDIKKTSESQWTVVNDFETSKKWFSVKQQCMHCSQPACASACLTKAMEKTKLGPVIWHEDKCMGCRACMLSCPFNIPKFEANDPNPKIQKCRMCYERLQDGEIPVCVENCYGEALTFGTRREILEIAKTRIYSNPDSYYHHIYGEHEVGGTGVLYLSAVPFEEMGFNMDLGSTPFPEYTKGFLYSVPLILILWPIFLLGLSDSIKEPKPIPVKNK